VILDKLKFHIALYGIETIMREFHAGDSSETFMRTSVLHRRERLVVQGLNKAVSQATA
jgi:hypothetical protein